VYIILSKPIYLYKQTEKYTPESFCDCKLPSSGKLTKSSKINSIDYTVFELATGPYQIDSTFSSHPKLLVVESFIHTDKSINHLTSFRTA